MTRNLVFLGIGGALGTWARFGVSAASHRLLGSGFPWGTLVVNTAGSFLIAFAATWADARGLLTPGLRLLLLVGFLGAFTTFSALTWETWEMARNGSVHRAFLNAGANLGLGFTAVFAGILLAQALALPVKA